MIHVLSRNTTNIHLRLVSLIWYEIVISIYDPYLSLSRYRPDFQRKVLLLEKSKPCFVRFRFDILGLHHPTQGISIRIIWIYRRHRPIWWLSRPRNILMPIHFLPLACQGFHRVYLDSTLFSFSKRYLGQLLGENFNTGLLLPCVEVVSELLGFQIWFFRRLYSAHSVGLYLFSCILELAYLLGRFHFASTGASWLVFNRVLLR